MLTISDGVAAGTRDDSAGRELAQRLGALAFTTAGAVVLDDPAAIRESVSAAATEYDRIGTTGGTGLGPRDTTPQTLRALLDYEIPGFGEVMRAHGRRSTPFADLSRSLGGVIGHALVLAVSGSPRAALESLAAVEPILDHAIETLRGHTEHRAG